MTVSGGSEGRGLHIHQQEPPCGYSVALLVNPLVRSLTSFTSSSSTTWRFARRHFRRLPRLDCTCRVGSEGRMAPNSSLPSPPPNEAGYLHLLCEILHPSAYNAIHRSVQQAPPTLAEPPQSPVTWHLQLVWKAHHHPGGNIPDAPGCPYLGHPAQ